ncbi:MAG TPA: tetratricopeptide repeat protein [Candidatus Binatia bacterium]|jgi:regulator of sirC expression with transglutaminase-like and TPR domain|nr:tetratricopeptide repeat protein [Candidatus Binatia bacterium]
MSRLRDEFAALVAPPIDLGRAALAIGRLGTPELDVAPALAALDALAADARAHVPRAASPAEAGTALATHLFRTRGFRGNAEDYYDPRNSFLDQVLARRLGIPITLTVVLIEVGARLGIPVEGVGFPGHFLARIPSPEGAVVVDPFHAGRRLDRDALLERYRAFGDPDADAVPPGALATTDTAGILVRMLGNLLRICLERTAHHEALETVDLLLVLRPASAEHVRMRGFLHAELECFGAARDDLRRYLALAPDAPDAHVVLARLAAVEQHGRTLH